MIFLLITLSFVILINSVSLFIEPLSKQIILLNIILLLPTIPFSLFLYIKEKQAQIKAPLLVILKSYINEVQENQKKSQIHLHKLIHSNGANNEKSFFHDINHHLFTATIQLSNTSTDNNAKALEYLKKAQSQTNEFHQSLIRITDNIENIISLDEILSHSCEAYRETALKKGIAVRYRNNFTLIKCSKTLMTGCINQLIQLAIRKTEKGGILIGIRPNDGDINLNIYTTEKPKKSAQYTLNKSLSLDFHTLTNIPYENELSIAFILSQMSGCRLLVTSIKNKGSTYTLTIPQSSLHRPYKP